MLFRSNIFRVRHGPSLAEPAIPMPLRRGWRLNRASGRVPPTSLPPPQQQPQSPCPSPPPPYRRHCCNHNVGWSWLTRTPWSSRVARECMCTQEDQVNFVVTSFHNTTTTRTTAQLWGDGVGHEHTVLSADEEKGTKSRFVVSFFSLSPRLFHLFSLSPDFD